MAFLFKVVNGPGSSSLAALSSKSLPPLVRVCTCGMGEGKWRAPPSFAVDDLELLPDITAHTLLATTSSLVHVLSCKGGWEM